jgi:hypothetical protein
MTRLIFVSQDRFIYCRAVNVHYLDNGERVQVSIENDSREKIVAVIPRLAFHFLRFHNDKVVIHANLSDNAASSDLTDASSDLTEFHSVLQVQQSETPKGSDVPTIKEG